MLSSFLSQLSSLMPSTGSGFIASAVFPMSAFFLANGVMLYWLNGSFRAAIDSVADASAADTSLFAIALAFVVAMLAYAFSALVPAVQLLMEGRWPPALARLFVAPQVRRREALEEELRQTYRARGRIQAREPEWIARLATARNSKPRPSGNTFTRDSPASKTIARLEALRRSNQPIPAGEIGIAVDALAQALKTHDADKPGPDGDHALDSAHGRLKTLITYARHVTETDELRLTNAIAFSFGSQLPAPTRMGNTSNTVQSYANDRYKLNFALFWTRLQRSVLSDEHFGPVLRQTTTQLEFFIACSALTLSWGAIWMAVVWSIDGPRSLFLLAAIAGPLGACVWYRAAVAHYATHADVLRTAIDLFRLKLLTDLHHPLPSDVTAECELWDHLHRLHLLNEPHGLRFEHPKAP